jgi:hypothetical protein
MSTTDNKLIAEFLGYTQPHPDYPDSTYWYKEGKAPLTILLFDTDWNWLMQVVEKILNISLELDSMETYYNITDSIPNIEQTHEAVVKFVKLYNNQDLI